MKPKKLEKQLKKAAKKVEGEVRDGLDRVRPGRSGNERKGKGKIVAAAAGAAAVGAVGVAAALKYRNRGWKRYLVAPADGDGWTLVREGSDDPLATFARKRDAVDHARKLANENTPSVLVIHGAHGKVLKSHSYPGDDG